MKNKFSIITLILSFFLLFSCVSPKKLVYVQDISASKLDQAISYQSTLQPDDLLQIVRSSEYQELATPFNLSAARTLGPNNQVANQQTFLPYLIDNSGQIDMPVLGKIKLSGLTKTEALQKIELLLKGKLINPTVTLRILNFKISVLGEVNKPGVHNINSERITLLEALSLSGDLTVYGKRSSILVMREKDGIKAFERIDITKSDFINSPFYYLAQNDVVYVEPNKTKVSSSVIGPNITVAISAISLLITIVALTTR